MKAPRKLKKPSSSKPTKKALTYPRRAGDVFVTQKMLFSVRDELIAYTGVKFHEVKAEIHEVKVEMNELRAEIHGIKAEIHELKAQISQLEKTVHKIALLVEEQNNRNKIVLDGLSHLFERQERIEKKVDSNLV